MTLLTRVLLGVAALGGVQTAAGQTHNQRRLFSSSFGYPGFDATYDYVVIGGGTAGLTLASRLASSSRSVAVVEAGGFYEVENGNNSVVPLLSLTGIAFIDPTPGFLSQPLMDWSLVTEPIPGADGRRVHYAQAKTLGGSSAINTMSYIRGTRGSYAKWADAVGDPSYTWDAMLPHFKKSVRLTPPDPVRRQNTNVSVTWDRQAFSAAGGPLDVSWNNWVDPTLTWMAKAVNEAGLPVSPRGFHSGELAGYGSWVPSTIEPRRAVRSSSESSFLREAIEETDNLAVYTHTRAVKILFDEKKKAIGVRVSTLGQEYTLSARREVVLSAGTFHSPQLLMLSGVGPATTLSAHGIPLVAEVPGVGQNLYDPVQIFAAYPANTPSGQTLTANPALVQRFKDEYLSRGAGPFSSAAGFLANERVPPRLRTQFSNATLAKLATYPQDFPELSYIVGSFVGPNLSTTATTAVFAPIVFSRGNVTLSSSSPTDPPLISPNWFSDPADMEILVAGLRRLREDVWHTPAADRIKAGPELSPGEAVVTDAQLREYVRANAIQIWHASSTCAMGRAGDVGSGKAVVDSRAKVFGVTGLRVVDASVFPFGLPGHPQAAVYALAEKIADDIIRGR